MEPLPLSTVKDRLRWIKSNLRISTPDYYGEFHYSIEYAGFSDYSGCMVERANSRYLEEKFSFVTLDLSGFFGTVYTVIRNRDVLDAILHEDFTDFMEEIDSLSDYPCLDDDLLSEMETEAETKAWEDWGESDFAEEIERAHRPQLEADIASGIQPASLLEPLDLLSQDNLIPLFLALCETSGRYWQIETGGNAWIDLKKLVESLPYKTFLEVLTGAYFIKPDAVQTVLPLLK